MNVMVISGEYPSEKAGGIASVVYDLCKEFDKRKIEYKIVCTKEFEFETERGVFLNAWGRHPIHDITFGLNFKKFIEKEKGNWDVFHFHLPNARGPLLFSNNLRNKSLVTFHTTSEGYNKYVYQKLPFRYLNRNEKILKLKYIKISVLLEKMALKNAANVVAVSSGVKKDLNSWYVNKNVEVINNGIDISKLHASNISEEKNKPIILDVGRLVAQKGIFLGIRALASVKEDFNFLVVGKGSLRHKLEEYCSKKDIPAKFLGFVESDELYRLYSKSDILLMPSFYEGLPMVGIEGAGSGLPIAAFEGARVVDIVCEENRELIVKTGDVNALSRSIEYLLDNEAIRSNIGRKNRENVLNNFSSGKMAEKYIQIYKEMRI
jgi:glycosyltransferase involved in cell wall biosynthesis